MVEDQALAGQVDKRSSDIATATKSMSATKKPTGNSKATHKKHKGDKTVPSTVKEPKSRFTAVGAPSQSSQPSRKGKRAWRKNVDIEEVEAGLEELREEERVTGGPLHKKADDELFTIDLTGDAQIRQRVKTKKPLTSTLILSQRSAVPAVSSRGSRENRKSKSNLTREEKERLLRIGKRKRTGLFNAEVDTTKLGEGSALLEPSVAVKTSGTYNVWMDVDESGQTQPKSQAVQQGHDDFVKEIIEKKSVKSRTVPTRDMIYAPAVPSPHQGISYNPPVNAYRDLLRSAHQVEERKVVEEEKYGKVKEAMDSARRTIYGSEVPTAEGMIIDVPLEDAEDAVDAENAEIETVEQKGESSVAEKRTRRKTTQQRQKALRVLEEQRAIKDRIARKRILATLDRIKALRAEIEAARNEQERKAAERKLEKMEQLRKGLAGRRLGKHRVPEGDIDVQLGDDLSESLRGLKVEGNLFKDRFLSMQHRALVEPRARVFPTRRKIKVKELEKYAWKRFT